VREKVGGGERGEGRRGAGQVGEERGGDELLDTISGHGVSRAEMSGLERWGR
jgi:hypothetical protein